MKRKKAEPKELRVNSVSISDAMNLRKKKKKK